MKAFSEKLFLNFINPGGTSRGVLHQKETYFLYLKHANKIAVGECPIFRGLSFDDFPNYEEKLNEVCQNVNLGQDVLMEIAKDFPSIKFGINSAFRNLALGENVYFDSDFTKKKKSIKINGLIWMGSKEFIISQIQEKLHQNYSCLKLKIGVDWETEKLILKDLRQKFPADRLEIRVDANAAFSFEKAKNILDELSVLEIHSIEQPIATKHWREMQVLCRESPTDIVLDEELIGVFGENKQEMLSTIMPQYIILKPSLLGSFAENDAWINCAESLGIKWWITSALESNIGLNTISQYTATKHNSLSQGLGTGSLFSNNTKSSLKLISDQLWFDAD